MSPGALFGGTGKRSSLIPFPRAGRGSSDADPAINDESDQVYVYSKEEDDDDYQGDDDDDYQDYDDNPGVNGEDEEYDYVDGLGRRPIWENVSFSISPKIYQSFSH